MVRFFLLALVGTLIPFGFSMTTAHADILDSQITVAPEIVTGHIDNLMYGSCIEDVNHEIYGGLYDQKIFGESFEEPLTSQGVPAQWTAVGATSPENFYRDLSDPYNGLYSLRITRGSVPSVIGVANSGLNHWGIAVAEGQVFQGHVYVRSGEHSGSVTVALQSSDGARTYASETLTNVGSSWQKFNFHLKSNATDGHARFAILIDTPGTVWVDQAALFGTGSEQFKDLPVRADIANALIAGHVTFLRYGGSMVNASGYRWKDMIGDRDKRPSYVGTWYPYSSNGFGIFDFLSFCDAAHIEAAFAINIEETDQDAADLADYLTAPTTNPWGHQRAVDGHPAPYTVKYIEIGNEESIGNDDPAAYLHYAQRFNRIAKAIHGRNPDLQLVCAAWWRPDSPNMKTVFDVVQGQAAAWDLHVWCDDANAGTDVERQIIEMQQKFDGWDPNTKLKAVIFEENGNTHNLQRALGHATTLNATLRHGDFVVADCAANCLQALGQNDNGWDQGQVFYTPTQVWGMPPYYAHQMASSVAQPLLVQSNTDSPNDELSVTATKSADSKSLVLLVVNTGKQDHEAQISLGSFHASGVAAVTTLSGNLSDVNTPEDPTKISPKKSDLPLTGSQFSETFPALSYTTVVIPLAAP
jgi:alpha-L-arabinofuranosidase